MFRYESSFSLSVQFLRIPLQRCRYQVFLAALSVPPGRTPSTGTYVDPLVAWSHVHGLDHALRQHLLAQGARSVHGAQDFLSILGT
ncbi:hypothetical protein M758_12G049900 [Ceratodon purpureus]|nr:hypothetical protein M758_12G049900 [Ceratodon purpureus]